MYRFNIKYVILFMPNTYFDINLMILISILMFCNKKTKIFYHIIKYNSCLQNPDYKIFSTFWNITQYNVYAH